MIGILIYTTARYQMAIQDRAQTSDCMRHNYIASEISPILSKRFPIAQSSRGKFLTY